MCVIQAQTYRHSATPVLLKGHLFLAANERGCTTSGYAQHQLNRLFPMNLGMGTFDLVDGLNFVCF